MSFDDDADDRFFNWRKARYSIACGECIEAASAGRHVAVRDSRDPDGTRLAYPAESWLAFVAKIKSS